MHFEHISSIDIDVGVSWLNRPITEAHWHHQHLLTGCMLRLAYGLVLREITVSATWIIRLYLLAFHETGVLHAGWPDLKVVLIDGIRLSVLGIIYIPESDSRIISIAQSLIGLDQVSVCLLDILCFSVLSVWNDAPAFSLNSVLT